mgnify:FL=1
MRKNLIGTADGPDGGFTIGTPWIMLNSDYPQINVEKARKEPDSVLHFYRSLWP